MMKNNMQNKNYVSFLLAFAVLASFLIAVPAFAQTSQPSAQAGRIGRGMMNRGQAPIVIGTVSAINGTSITVNSKARPNGGTATTYTVDASGAIVTKNGTASSVSSIAAGDTIMVQGTASGTSVVAKTIRDGTARPQTQPAIQGNGQPVVAGTVASISGDIITITNKSNVTYTVNVSSAKFVVAGVTSPVISNVAVGDNLTVQGTVNGSSVVASSVIDQKAKVKTGKNENGNSSTVNGGFMGNIMGGIGNLFRRLFGF